MRPPRPISPGTLSFLISALSPTVRVLYGWSREEAVELYGASGLGVVVGTKFT